MTDTRPQLLCNLPVKDCEVTNSSLLLMNRNWIIPVSNYLNVNNIKLLLPLACPLPYKSETVSFYQKFENSPLFNRSIRKILVDSAACQVCKLNTSCPVHFNAGN